MSIESLFENGISLIKAITPCEASETIIVDKKPSSKEFASTESQIGRSIPDCIRNSMGMHEYHISWIMDSLSDDLPEEYDHLCSGRTRWNLEAFRDVELDKQSISSKIKGSKKSKDILLSAFAFAYCFFDSFIALDSVGDEQGSRVVLLEIKGKAIKAVHVISPNLDDFIKNWSDLAFFELSIDSLSSFTDNFQKPLSSQSEFAQDYIAWLKNG